MVPDNTKEVNREHWVDAAKGVMILLVVFGHAWRGLYASDLVPAAIFSAVDSRLYAFHMPVFFALSGWFLCHAKTRRPWLSFSAGKVRRLFWPMVLWTYIFLILKYAAGPFANSPVTLEDVLVSPVPGVLHLWFLWALLLLSLGFSWLRLFDDPTVPAVLSLVVSVFAVASMDVFQWPPVVLHWIGPAVVNAPFFLLGVVLREARLLSAIPRWWPIFGAGVFILLIAAWPMAAGFDFGGLLRLLSVFSLLVVMGYRGKGCFGTRAPRLLLVLGISSLAIYLMHTIFSASMRELLLAFGVQSLGVHLVLGTGIGVLAPLLCLMAARRLGISRWLGL